MIISIKLKKKRAKTTNNSINKKGKVLFSIVFNTIVFCLTICITLTGSLSHFRGKSIQSKGRIKKFLGFSVTFFFVPSRHRLHQRVTRLRVYACIFISVCGCQEVHFRVDGTLGSKLGAGAQAKHAKYLNCFNGHLLYLQQFLVQLLQLQARNQSCGTSVGLCVLLDFFFSYIHLS